MTIRVIMIGPGKGVIGGILSLVETIVPILENHLDLLYFSTVKGRPLKKSGKFSLRNIALAMDQYARFFYSLYRFHPQIIHIHTSQGIAWLKDTFYILVAKFRDCRVLVHIHAENFNELYGKRSRPYKYYTRKVMGLADAVIAVSEEWKNRIISIVPKKKVFVFKNCINVNIFSTCTSNYTKNGTKALFLGSVGPRKGAFDLLDAVGLLKPKNYLIEVWIAGYEEREGDLARAQDRLKNLKLEKICHLVGTVSGEKKLELFRKANLFVLPSHNEGLPVAVLEAMAAGLAVVSTTVGGIPEVLKDGYNGYLVNPRKVEDLSKKLEILCKNQDLLETMGRRSLKIAQHDLDVNPYIKRLLELYKSIQDQ